MRGVHCSNQGMNTDTHNPSSIEETDLNAIPSGELFVSLAMALIVVTALYLLVALFTSITPWNQTASAAIAALTAGLC